MSIWETVFYLLLNTFRVYIMYRFSRLFFGPDKQKRWLKHSYAAFCIVNSLVHLTLSDGTVNLAVNIGGVLLVIICGYEGSIKRKLLTAAASFGINLLTEDMAWVIFVKGRNSQMMEFGFFFSVFLLFLIEFIIEKLLRFHKEIDIPLNKDLLLIVISAGSMFISVTMIEGFYQRYILLVVSLSILLLINMAVFYLYEKLQEDYLRQKEKEVYKQQLIMYRNQLKIMQNANDTYKSMRHNIKSHMFMISDYIAKNENEKALEYFEKMNYYVGNGEEYIKTGNESIDSIFNYFINEINEIKGKIKTDIKIAEGMRIDDFDMNVILSNLLMNACEAISKCEEKLIHAVMRYDRGALVIKIDNTYNGKVERNGEDFLSTKEDSSEHGIGLGSVKKTVEKYNGQMEISYTEKKFTVKILIYI